MSDVLFAFAGVAALTGAGLASLWYMSPSCHVVHAAHAKALNRRPNFKWWPIGLVRDTDGHIVPVAESFLGCTDGDSMKPFGIPNGSRFVADKLSDGARKGLSFEDIVVVNGKAERSESGYRLRRIDHVDGEQAFFLADGKGFDHRPRPLAEVVAKVTHVL